MENQIMLIPLHILPIPSVKGGAIETLVTALLEENEKEELAEFVCTSIFDVDASNKKYEHSCIYYFDEEGYLLTNWKKVKQAWKYYNLWIKLFHNRITYRLFGKRQVIEDFKIYQYYWIARKHRVKAIVNEGREDDRFLAPLSWVVGEENIYNHIHFERKEDLRARNCIHNSISISEYIKDQWVVDKSIIGKNIVLFNGIDIERFSTGLSSDERSKRRQALGITDSDILVFFCARIYPGKGVRELLDCFELLKDKPIKLLLIGNAPDDNAQDIGYAEDVLSRAERMDNIIPLGYIPYDKIHEYYAISDIVTIPSICQEGAGLVAIEGMASELPLITTISGGMVEYVTDETAVQIPISKNLPKDLATAIQDLADNPEKRKAMGLAGKNWAAQFSNNAYYHNFIKILFDTNED